MFIQGQNRHLYSKYVHVPTESVTRADGIEGTKVEEQ